ncbi:MAG TPA: hypothetical protein VK828_03660 [Terriglobales bacterium]|jgi:hypothetical protein|nr:hypothetical protein [Terriglobales bacterium]
MANREVNLTKRIQTAQEMRYCQVLLAANGRVKSDLVLVNGMPETHKEGAYYLLLPSSSLMHGSTLVAATKS